MTFKRLALLGKLDLTEEAKAALAKLCDELVFLEDVDPTVPEAVAGSLAGCDAAIVHWQIPVGASAIASNPALRYLGLCASPFAQLDNCNIDLDAADRAGVVVSTLGQYGDEATAEWVIASMLNAAHHIGDLRWRPYRCELFGKRLAVIGLGPVGWEVAQRAKALGMNIVYTARRTKPHAGDAGFEHLSLRDAVATADVITVHIAKGVQIFGAEEFEAIKPGALLINTSIGTVFEPDAFAQWLSSGGGCALADTAVEGTLVEVMRARPNAAVSDQGAADTVEMKQRKSAQLVENAQAYLVGSPIRRHP